MALIEVESFEFRRGHLRFNNPELWCLDPGNVLAIREEPDAYVSEFLQVLAGLDDFKRVTQPAEKKEVIRRLAVPHYTNDKPVRIAGKVVRELSSSERAAAIAFVFDNPELSVLGSTVAEEFRYSAAALGKTAPGYPSVHVLERYGLADKLERRTEVLSGGERHRLAIACAMERDSRALILDLTRSNLDCEFEEWLLARIDPWLDVRSQAGGAAVIIAGISVARLKSAIRAPLFVGRLFNDGTFSFGESIQGEDEGNFPLLRPRSVGDEVVISATDIGRLHYGRRQSLELKRGEILAFHGPNGCGKTSIALLLAGRENPHRFAGSFTAAHGVIPSLAVQHAERSFLGTTVHEELGDAGLEAKLGLLEPELRLHPRHLPYRKQKLVSVAVAISLADGVAILDEPTCGMDWRSRAAVVELIDLRPDTAFLVFTHDPVLQRSLGSRELGT
jgi:energy-coupling factor transport system ATP-binding protein